MRRSVRLAALGAFLAAAALPAAAPAKIVLLGTRSIPGTATDRSGLTDVLPDGTPHNRLGAMGSALAYTGQGSRYVMIADRGPHDGAVAYFCRFHLFDIPVTPGQTPAVQPSLLSTTLLKDAAGRQYVGLATAFGDRPDPGPRLDPEGVRVARNGNLFVSDEYGPFVLEFDREGREVRQLKVPDHFRVEHPGAGPKEEGWPHNTRGRQTNRGMEGLAIAPDGRKLYGIMQSCLLQDGRFDPKKKYVVGVNVRILEIDTQTDATREFVYPLDDPRHGINEIVAVNDHVFLVLERDNKAGDEARFKKLFRIDISGASDVSDVAALPEKGLPPGKEAVKKTLFLDLLDPELGLKGPTCPEKFEGLAFGPDLPDGRHLLLLTTDNDLEAEQSSQFYAFAIDGDDLPGFERQVFDQPAEAADMPLLVRWGGVIVLCLVTGVLAAVWASRMRRRPAGTP
jgi:hypothetical protein